MDVKDFLQLGGGSKPKSEVAAMPSAQAGTFSYFLNNVWEA